jgi:hypothetical protein
MPKSLIHIEKNRVIKAGICQEGDNQAAEVS